MLIAVNYHYIRPSFDSPHPAIFGVTPAEFESQLQLFGSIGAFASADDVRAALNQDGLEERTFVITFDDGLREQYNHAWPILRRLGIPALFFINTAPIAGEKILTVHQIHLLRSHLSCEEFLNLLQTFARELAIDLDGSVDSETIQAQYQYDSLEAGRLKYLLNFQLEWRDRERLIDRCFQHVFPGRESQMSRELYMSVAQIRELAAFHCIGSHTHEHLPVGLLPEDKAAEQIVLASSHLREWTGYPPFALSYPFGSREACAPRLTRHARQAGIEFAFTMERAGNTSLAHPFHLARLSTNDAPGGANSRWTAGSLFQAIPAAKWGAQPE
jgi:peptidoglycan/xylan/chitin deacetylase (PgdA/CDA1 family)